MSFPEDEDTWWVDLYMLVLVLCALLCGPGAHVNIWRVRSTTWGVVIKWWQFWKWLCSWRSPWVHLWIQLPKLPLKFRIEKPHNLILLTLKIKHKLTILWSNFFLFKNSKIQWFFPFSEMITKILFLLIFIALFLLPLAFRILLL